MGRLTILKTFASLSFCLMLYLANSQNYSAGINTETPNPNAVLHLVSPGGNQGILIPQLTSVQRSGIALSASDNGLLVYDNNDGLFYYWLDPGWIALSISDSQNLRLVGTTLSIDNGNSIDLATINFAESDPTVPDVIKDGVDWTELSGIPADFIDNIDDVDDADNDPTNEIELPSTATTNDVLIWNGSSWIASTPAADGDADPTNEIELPSTAITNQVLTWNGTSWVAGNSPADADSDPTNEIELPATATTNEVLLWNGTAWVAGPDAVADADNDPANEIELPATATTNEVLLWNGTAWVAGPDAVADADNDPVNEIELPATATTDEVLLWNGTAWVAGPDAGITTVNVDGATITGDGVGNPLAIGTFPADSVSTGLVNNTEFNFLDGLNQNLTTISNVTFNGISATNGAFSSLGISTTAQLNGNTFLGNEATDQITVTGGIIFDEATQDILLNVNDQSVAGGQLIIPDIQGNTRTFAFQETSSLFNVVNNNYYSNSTSLPAVTSGTENVLIGTNAGANINTASNNVFLGASAGLNTDTGNDNVAIGNGADINNATDPNGAVAIGNGALVQADLGIALGTNSNASGLNTVSIGAGVASNQDFSIVLGDNTPVYRVGINNPAPTEELEVEGDVRINGSFITPPGSGLLNIAVAIIPSPTERIIKLNPSIGIITNMDDTNAIEGQEVILVNVGISDVQIDSELPGGGSFVLSSTSYTLRQGGTLHMVYILNPLGDGVNRWVEIGRSQR